MGRPINTRADVLLVGQTPPPYHGQAVVTAMLFEHDWPDLEVVSLRMSYSESIDEVGKVALSKIFHLFELIIKTWWLVLVRRPQALYYLPASANRAPVIRDIIYLGMVRWLFAKTIFHYHAGGLPEYLDGAGLVGKLGIWAYSNADVSIEICQTEHSPGRELRAKRSVLIPNGVDIEMCRRARSDDGETRVLFLGALNEGKGVIDIIDTARLLKARRADVRFQLVGAWASSEFKKEAEAKIEDHGLQEHILFTGPLSGKEKWQAYADADVFFFPSHYQSENFPLVMIEAMAFSLPVVSTCWRGIPQLVGDSGAAILREINSPEQYADAIEGLVDEPGKRQQMGRAARAHYEASFSREIFLNGMEQVLRTNTKN